MDGVETYVLIPLRWERGYRFAFFTATIQMTWMNISWRAFLTKNTSLKVIWMLESKNFDASISISLPFLPRDLRSDQAGHLYAYIFRSGGKSMSLEELGVVYPNNFEVSGRTFSRTTYWGPGYDGDCLINEEGRRR